MTTIIGTGISGLVGSRITELLSADFSFEEISRSTGIDITDNRSVLQKISSSNSPFVLHLAAKADVDGCELDKPLGVNGDAWKINVIGTKNIADACLQTGKKLLYISTDFVFDGEKADGYTEEDMPNPINWYAETKYEGEKIVSALSSPWMILRIAYPYRSQFPKKDFLRAMLARLQEGKPIAAITDHVFTPTYIDDVAYAIKTLIEKNETGIFHVVGSESLSPYDAALKIVQEFALDKNLISATTRSEYFQGKAPRPFHLSMRNDKIEKLGITMHGFSEGLAFIKKSL